MLTSDDDGRSLSIASIGRGSGRSEELYWTLASPCDDAHMTPAREGRDFAQSADKEGRAIGWLAHSPGLSLKQAHAAPLVEDRIQARI